MQFQDLLTVTLCCLDAHGDVTDQLNGVDFDGEVSFSFPDPLTISFHQDGALSVGTCVVRRVRGSRISDCVGSMCHRVVELDAPNARALVAHLIAQHVPDAWVSPSLFEDLIGAGEVLRLRRRVQAQQSAISA